MSAFEVTFTTPTRVKTKKRNESHEPTVVVMAPFSTKAIVQFEDVPVTKTAKRILRIMNTSDADIQVKVNKAIPAEHNVSIDWTENVIPALKEISMEMVWSPLMVVSCAETLQFLDNRNFRKDVMIILKSKCTNPPKNTRKYPTIGKTLRLKSPSGNKKSTKTIVHQQRKNLNTSKSTAASSATSSAAKNTTKQQWRNVSTYQQKTPQPKKCADQSVHTKTRSNMLNAPHIAPLTERNVFLDACDREPLFISPPANGGCKENVSPITPGNVLNMFDDFKFTPATDTLPKVKKEDLASWPTPVERDYSVPYESINEVRPRRLAPDLLLPEDNLSTTMTHTLITNKTFDVKHSETLDSSVDILELTRNESVLQTPTLNKTTTLIHSTQLRQLTVIREEDAGSPPNEFKINTVENLKRDIKMVGSPLRKFSESMKDLSFKSNQAKVAIQGSMPNLNEMEEIRSIEQNRYYQPQMQPRQMSHYPTKQSMDSPNSSNASETSLIMNAELLFNQNEILAQSSRFNLHEIGVKSRKNSPISNKAKAAQHKCIDTTPKSTTKSSHKRRSNELSFSASPNNESFSAEQRTNNNTNSCMLISPPKRQRIDSMDNAPINASATRVKNWSQTQPKKVKLAQTLSLMRKANLTPRKPRLEKTVKLYDSDLYMQSIINPDPFSATTTTDPFLASTMYLDERAVDRHQDDLKKWLNALVSIPADLDADCDAKVDVGKLFSEVRNKELIIAPSKEEQSMNYLTTFRLESLRRAAVELFFSEEMRVPCSKVAVYVNKNLVCIRKDRNLHLDVVMQRYILELLLCFNPLWLRLGLEVVYAEKIHLQSNRDILGLTTFILNRLFRNKFEEQKVSKAYILSEEYAANIKKFTLQKVLFLLLFLDKAKEKRIIKHNPCLFVKKSPHKETKDILLRFASELLANIGDITRDMRRLGYVLLHKQTYLDEYNYAFNNLAVDLRDGIRLTRVMEIILLRDELSKQLRVPAISRLQRVFNVNLALRALAEADFVLKGEITATDIVDGHREKTLSLLWQIIYKFRSPKFHAAARVLQQWWRHLWLRVVIMRRIRHKEQLRRERAATVIQAHFRGYQMRKYTKVYREERLQAVLVLQKNLRRYLAQKQLYQTYASILLIQRWYRNQRLTRVCRASFIRLRESVIFLQRIWRRRLFVRKLLFAAEQARLQRAQKEHAAAMHIQKHWQAWRLGHMARQEYHHKRTLIIRVQQRIRSTWAMKEQRQRFLHLKQAAINIQRRYRAKRLMEAERANYLKTRGIIVMIQQHWRATLQMRLDRQEFIKLKTSVIFVQRKMRAKWQMQIERRNYSCLKKAASLLQLRYRNRMAMKLQMAAYQDTRQKIIYVQRKWRATMQMRKERNHYLLLVHHAKLVQQKFRSTKLMRQQRADFLLLRKVTVQTQQRYRAKLLARRDQANFLRLRSSALTIQCRFRAYKQMRFFRAKYQGTQAAVTCLQMHFRGYLQMKRQRSAFLKRRCAAITLQRAYRNRTLMLTQQGTFLKLKAAVLSVQQRWRATLTMRRAKAVYHRHRGLIVMVQRQFRAKVLGRQVRQCYMKTVEIVVRVQQRFRATMVMRQVRTDYLTKRTKILTLQQHFRAHLAMKYAKAKYIEQRNAIIRIQLWYRNILKMRQNQHDYQRVRNSSLTIQRKWRATLAARRERNCFLNTLEKICHIQRVLRATLEMRKIRSEYQRKRWAAIVFQQRYRAHNLMRIVRSQYLLIHTLVICLQRKFRAHRAMLVVRDDYELLRRTTIHLQQKHRGRKIMCVQRQRFQLLRKSVVDFQAHARGNLARKRFQALMTPEMMDFLRRKKAAKVIQRYWRGYRTRKCIRSAALKAIRQRVIKLKQEATVMNSVRIKVQEAVRFLRGRFIASEALTVLNRLDRLSRTVPHLLMPCSEFMSTFCYGIMAQAIRSEVDKQIIECCSRIILNLARYNCSTVNTFQEGGLVTIAQMLLRWCDKDCEIFNTLCTLIWVFSQCPKKRRIIYEYMTTTDAIYMVRETKKLVARKEKMKQNARKPPPCTSRGNAQQQQITFPVRALPSLEPDFGIIRNRPYTFISSVYAFDTILSKLGIDIF